MNEMLEGLKILKKYCGGVPLDTDVHNGQIYAGPRDLSAYEMKIPPEDLKRLDGLGWFIDEGSWSRFV